ncbi:Retrovirus-related Pol polyprotein from type-1 retrotransposable element R2-like Protein [Tribolium castaneum]|uniref:Retrovirus-related Pol polyprotein from type-1 retrotransposable element R2-like Protein n=1 Tax=Tribolium castaneum TaxID=7070 RepID=D7EKN7_TRICA|nr:Retrovirus-related Pol polyprotein from type-1 retrotransposable element R2-like Protein [Tribolium castaneum]
MKTKINKIINECETCLQRPPITFSHHKSQVLTGHGNFGIHQLRLGKSENSLCPNCPDYDDDPVHRILECPLFGEVQERIRGITGTWPPDLTQVPYIDNDEMFSARSLDLTPPDDEDTSAILQKLDEMTTDTPPDHQWRENIIYSPFSSGLELSAQEPANRGWIDNKPKGWTGRDFVRAIHLRTANLPSRGIPSNPPEDRERKCRNGCGKTETICHILQNCPQTHGLRILRHKAIAKTIAKHCQSNGWKVEEEPHVRHPSGQLFKPDLVVHTSSENMVTSVGTVQPA